MGKIKFVSHIVPHKIHRFVYNVIKLTISYSNQMVCAYASKDITSVKI